mgnify:CR=1 FL=1
MKVRYSYLPQQFAEIDDLLVKIKEFVKTGDFTLGRPLEEFEKKFAKLMNSKYAIGVNSGTDAIKLSLKALGVGYGDEVITASNTFIATVGAISEIGAKPVLVDCDDTFCMNVDLIESVITKKTKAIVPVHFTGYMTNMEKLKKIANKYKLLIIEDACQSILASQNNKIAGTWGSTGCFSLHPLKNLNVWSDGGVIITNEKKIYKKLQLLRNHGLKNRDEIEILGYNSRLDTIQAVVGNWLIPKTIEISKKRIKNATYYDKGFKNIKGIRIPPRPDNMRLVFHLYIVFAKHRDKLLEHCLKRDIEAKVHYPIPLYRQKALNNLSYKKGSFPVTDFHSKNIITFPVDQHLEKAQLDYVIHTVKDFYEQNKKS